MKSIIVDDEINSREVIFNMLQAYSPEIKVMAEAESAAEAQIAINKYMPDVVFLDIEMPDRNGIEFLNSFTHGVNFQTVFITAYNQYAINAIRSGATDYLLKPINPKEFKETIDKVVSKYNDNQIHYDDFPEKELHSQLIVPHKKGFRLVSYKNIIRFEADDNYTEIYLTDGTRLVTPKTLKEFELKLTSKWFFRIHRSHIVNLLHFKEYLSEDGGYAVMNDGSKVSISKNRIEEFFEFVHILARS
jgi:two-component system, LytTR family, response regulator